MARSEEGIVSRRAPRQGPIYRQGLAGDLRAVRATNSKLRLFPDFS